MKLQILVITVVMAIFAIFWYFKDTLRVLFSETLVNYTIDTYKNNKSEFVEGSLWIGLLGGISTSLYWLFTWMRDKISSSLLVTMTLHNGEEPFRWIINFLGKHPDFFLTAQTLRLHVEHQMNYNSDDKSVNEKQLKFTPGNGNHLLSFKGHLIWLDRDESNDVMTTGWDNVPFKFETITLTTFSRKNDLFEELIQDAMEDFLEKTSDNTQIFTMGRWGSWEVAVRKKARDFDSVILDSKYSEELYQDACNFFKKYDWYWSHGIPYRRGYLLYGPPGCGKTSFISALAGKLKLDICLLNLSSGEIDDNQLNQRLHEAPPNSIILLEDIDSIFVDRNVKQPEESRRVTFGGLLNALDGVGSQEGKLLFLTTNHIEKLDAALIRPGRCDVKIEFKLASKQQIKELFNRFYSRHDLAEEFVGNIPDHTVSMADLQGYLLESKTPEVAIAKVKSWLQGLQTGHTNPNVSLKEWLTRLGLSHFIKKFEKENLLNLRDVVKWNDSRNMKKLIPKTGEQDRVTNMLNGKRSILQDFQYASTESIRYVIKMIFQDASDELVDSFLKRIPNESKTFFEIRRFFFSLGNWRRLWTNWMIF
jgi:chaperone BCS1